MSFVRYSLVLVFAVLSAQAADWPNSLWLGRGDVWKSRFDVTIANPSAAALEGVPVAVPIGTASGQAPLTGARAEAVRVTDAAGIQLLYGLWTPDGEAFTTGAIPPNASLVLPAVCSANTSVTYTVYFDNPHAWGLADHFAKRATEALNGDFEKIAGGFPAGWRSKMTDAAHRVSSSAEHPFAGTRSLKAEADPDASASWFGAARDDFAVVPGAHCTLRVRVRGQNVKGSAGWYVHVGSDANSQLVNKTERAGEGTFDWKELTISFTVPEGATRMETGSVLRGSGTAWYDDFRFETDREPPCATAKAGAVERLELCERGATAAWPNPVQRTPRWLAVLTFSHDREASEWGYRLPVRLLNLRDASADRLLASVDLNSATRGIAAPKFLLTFEGAPVETCRLGDRLLFTCSLPPHTVATYYLYVADSGAKTAPATPAASALGSDIPSDQVLADHADATDAQAFAQLLNSPANLIRNPDFEVGNDAPDVWTHSAADKDTTFALGTPGGFGKRCVRMTVSPKAKETWRGWYQTVSVKPGHSYLYGAWLACENLEGSATLNAHMQNAKGAVVPGGFQSAGSPISGTTSWTPMFGSVTIPPDAVKFQMHLTMNDRGTLKHDAAFLAECLETVTGDPETPPLRTSELSVWPVDPVVKVFHETLPPHLPQPFAIALARGEEEALQLALRSGRDLSQLSIDVEAPADGHGHTLADFTVGWVGYVPIDHRTAYYNVTTPEWVLKFPSGSGSSDGWSGWWPDPIRPTASGDLAANQTQAIWISFKTSADATPGLYRGKIRLRADGKTLATLPFSATVWSFVLPQTPSCPAIFDLRVSQPWLTDGTPADVQRERMLRFMAAKKVCPDEIQAEPKFSRNAQGQIVADFTAYDTAAQHYFADLKFPRSYTPPFFYLFGWEHPPKDVLGEKPFEGTYPYKDADRTHLRQAYKDAYQACLRLYWDHMKAKGWADRFQLYISDEPFLTKKHIIDQMKACCDMIHAVDPNIRIYSSTWRHCPDWNGYLDIWGAGHYGCFPVSEMQARRSAGEHIWFTTDGQMCTDTPFCAVERLLPHYCFKYGAEAYEFWGVSWLTYDPWRFGWHSYIYQSSTPGESYYVRYPNGDGFLMYPGAPVGVQGPVTTVRLEAARDGVEDYEYLKLLKSFADTRHDAEAAKLLADFGALLDIPNAGGRFSSRILPDPARLAALRLQAGAALDRLTREHAAQ